MNTIAATDPGLWRRANLRMIEKLLSELSYEGLLEPSPLAAGSHAAGPAPARTDARATADPRVVAERRRVAAYTLDAAHGGYRWQGWINRWTQPVIVPDSVVDADGRPAHDAVRVLRDVLAPLGLPATTLMQYLREALNTLANDVQMLDARRGFDAAQWLALPDERLQTLLDGHPKAIPSKGRVGWGIDENRRYGPEHAPRFRLHWLAVARSLAKPVCAAGWDETRLLASSCDPTERDRLGQALQATGRAAADYWLLPVHPWQWQAMIAPQFAPLLADGALLHLGEAGDRYCPQQSLRTLSNADRPAEVNLKLPLTILNTSAYRGLPQRYLAVTPALSDWLQGLIAADPLLAASGTGALAEPAAAFVPHPLYHGMHDVPYQFDEMLGAVWRQSTASRCGPDERILMAAVLQQADDAGKPLLAELIGRSGLGTIRWLERLFDLAVVPLYHLQARHGLGFIAHGQNLMLRLRDDAPVGIVLKDYQGDLFRADAAWAQPSAGGPARLDPAVWQALPTMPPHYLVHNLWTGLFGSVFRFAATALDRYGLIGEEAFYALLHARLLRYQAGHAELASRFAELDLFAPSMPRLSLNRARLAAGYADAASRPIHALGPPLANPLQPVAAPQCSETSA